MSLESRILEKLREVLTELGLSFSEHNDVYDEDVPTRVVRVHKPLSEHEIKQILREVARRCNCEYNEQDNIFATEDDWTIVLTFTYREDQATDFTVIGTE